MISHLIMALPSPRIMMYSSLIRTLGFLLLVMSFREREMLAKRSGLSIVVAILKALSRTETVCSRLCEEVNMPYDRLKTLWST